MENNATISEHLLISYWKGEATEAESQQLAQWLAASSDNQQLFAKWQKAWEHAGALADFEAVDVEANWNQVQQKIQTNKKSARQLGFFPTVWRYAAAVVLIATVSFLAWQWMSVPEMLSVTASAAPVNVTLPDGTEVLLNKGATLAYPERFAGDSRQVELTGEAFFEVVHNPEKPFSVMADETETRVLGTSFNLNEKPGNALELVLLTGKVQFTRGTQEEVLTPGQTILVDEAGIVTKSLHEQSNSMSWRTRRLEFDSTLMADVVRDVELLYGVSVEVESEALLACPLTTTFQNDPVENVFETFKILFDARVEQNDQGYLIKGGGCQKE
jgi:ferric-dicitrate binding protein FerR (iron transport regulator)